MMLKKVHPFELLKTLIWIMRRKLIAKAKDQCNLTYSNKVDVEHNIILVKSNNKEEKKDKALLAQCHE